LLLLSRPPFWLKVSRLTKQNVELPLWSMASSDAGITFKALAGNDEQVCEPVNSQQVMLPQGALLRARPVPLPLLPTTCTPSDVATTSWRMAFCPPAPAKQGNNRACSTDSSPLSSLRHRPTPTNIWPRSRSFSGSESSSGAHLFAPNLQHSLAHRWSSTSDSMSISLNPSPSNTPLDRAFITSPTSPTFLHYIGDASPFSTDATPMAGVEPRSSKGSIRFDKNLGRYSFSMSRTSTCGEKSVPSETGTSHPAGSAELMPAWMRECGA